MSESWNAIFGGQFAKDNQIYAADSAIVEHTPIMYGDRVVGHTVGENKVGYPVKCVLYSQFLYDEETMDFNGTRRVVSMEIINRSISIKEAFDIE